MCGWGDGGGFMLSMPYSFEIDWFSFYSVTGTVLPCKSHSKVYSIPATDRKFIFRLYGWISHNFHVVLVVVCREHPWVDILSLRWFFLFTNLFKVFFQEPYCWNPSSINSVASIWRNPSGPGFPRLGYRPGFFLSKKVTPITPGSPHPKPDYWPS
jgi:hypothetical protein